MRVLLLGGTGAIGAQLTDILEKAAAAEIFVTSRSARAPRKNVTFITGNGKDPAFLNDVLSGHWDVIVDFMVYTTKEFQDRVSLLLNACRKYIFLSSARVFAPSDEPLTAHSPRLLDVSDDETYLATDEYALTKARQENLLRQSGRNNWTIVRPYITYGPSRLQLGPMEKEEWLYRAIKGRTIVFSSDIAAKITTMSFGGDVAEVLSQITLNPDECDGEEINIALSDAIKWEDVLNIYLNAIETYAGARPKVKFLGADDYVSCVASVPQVTYDRNFDRRFEKPALPKDNAPGVRIQPKQGLESCIREWLERDIGFGGVDWRLEAIKDRFTGEQASLAEFGAPRNLLKYLIYRYAPKAFLRRAGKLC